MATHPPTPDRTDQEIRAAVAAEQRRTMKALDRLEVAIQRLAKTVDERVVAKSEDQR